MTVDIYEHLHKRIAVLEAELRREQAETMAMGQSILTYDRQLQDSQIRVSSCLRRIAELEAALAISHKAHAILNRPPLLSTALEAGLSQDDWETLLASEARIAELEAEIARLNAMPGRKIMAALIEGDIRAAVLAEREACAVTAEEHEMLANHICDMPSNITAAIRARPAP